MRTKGQAAMEFLMTYGWAILAAIIAIGVLAYFGVFSPGKFVPSATVVNPPFYAEGAVINSSNIQIELRNNGGEDVTVDTIEIPTCGSTSPGTVLVNGNATVYTITCSPSLTGDTFKDDITVTYTKSGSSLDLKSTGTIAGKIT